MSFPNSFIAREIQKQKQDFLLKVMPTHYEDALKLAEGLKADKDPLYVRQSIALFDRGEDTAATELASKVRDTKTLSKSLPSFLPFPPSDKHNPTPTLIIIIIKTDAGLLPVARRRFATLLRDSSAHPTLRVALSLIPPDVHEWAMGAFAGVSSPAKPNPVSSSVFSFPLRFSSAPPPLPHTFPSLR